MAEFKEAMRQLGRICASNCGECDICDLRPFCPSRKFLDKYAESGRAERLEEIVMSWAAEHPEQVYPTWVDWLVDQGLIFVTSNTYAFNFLKATDPIPASIAEKLGLEPKEGV